MTKIRNVYINTLTSYQKAYCRVERFLDEASLYVMPPFLLVSVFLLFAQFDYIQNRYKRDLMALPIEKQQRYEYVKKEELKLWSEMSYYRKKLEFDKEKEIDKIRGPLNIERNKIYNSAPHTSWAYHFYVAIGAIKPF
ncbi:hypothetical protein [Sulfurimonas sp.]|jgi:hypothetical protein|uniref:hypothetical protein n=1 Tax=Sulfurimonas sp. TaxID=2022749 RepID=UPI00261AB716|nr:hypothetical protein [Sulfurimonas sp.]MDD3855649.1 hypothetical protein [Sulfurimonas sp.]